MTDAKIDAPCGSFNDGKIAADRGEVIVLATTFRS
jgi:hypothetical protein